MTIIKQQFIITYEREIDTDTGEIIKTTIVSSSDVKPVKKKVTKEDTDTEAKVYLEENKLRLNSLAVKLLNVNPGDRIDIQYTENSPVIGTSESFGTPESGTKLSNSHTLIYKGKKAETLKEYGTEFKVIESNGCFILDGGIVQPEFKGDDIINTENVDLNLEDFIEDTQEVKSSMFQL